MLCDRTEMNGLACSHLGRRCGPLFFSVVVLFTQLSAAAARAEQDTCPGRVWEVKSPSEVGLNPGSIEKIGEILQGRGQGELGQSEAGRPVVRHESGDEVCGESGGSKSGELRRVM
jgi:hypothetical protein